MNSYPKVLVVGVSFIPNTGVGITISNLFKNWPKDKLAVANYIIEGSDNSICENYYLLKSRINKNDNNSVQNVINKEPKSFIKNLKKIFRVLYSGFLNYLVLKGKYKQIECDDNFVKWVKDFNPCIIYAMPCAINQIPLLLKTSKKTGLPIALHIVDNWVNGNHFGILNLIGLKLLHFEFKKLLNRSTVLMGISKEMQIAYHKTYKRDFIPFHNPAQLEKWDKLTRKEWEYKEGFKIMFAGTIEVYNIDEIEDLCKAINNNEQIVLNLYGSLRESSFVDRLKKYKNCKMNGLISSEKIFELLVQHDLLFLPLSFNPKFKKNIILSMPTKISEYMISGTPILVYSQKDLALTKYALSDEWAYVVTDSGNEKLKQALYQLKGDIELRKKVAQKAIDVVKRNHDSNKIQNEFVQLLKSGIKK